MMCRLVGFHDFCLSPACVRNCTYHCVTTFARSVHATNTPSIMLPLSLYRAHTRQLVSDGNSNVSQLIIASLRYIHGGLYLDDDIELVRPASSFLHLTDVYVSVRELKFKSKPPGVFQALLLMKEQHPVIRNAIHLMQRHYESKSSLPGISQLGPYTLWIASDTDTHHRFFQEQCVVSFIS